MDTLLQTRAKTHGSYPSTARVSQGLKDVMKSGPNWVSLTDEQAESLEMIAAKVARILSGDPAFADHWDDVIGYAKLGRPETDALGAAAIADALKDIKP